MATEPVSSTAVLIAKAAPLVSKLASIFAEPAKGAAVRAKERLEVKFRKGFSRYIEENAIRFSTVKTIISSTTPIPLARLYVNLYLSHAEQVHRDDDFLRDVTKYRSIIFTATAGAGKSMLMRYLYLRFLETQSERLPVFIELRELNQYPAVTVEDFICMKIADYIDGFSSRHLRLALDTERVILFFDGFDEIHYDKREDRERQINELAARFKTLWIFLSSRPAETFANWEKFFVFKVEPFTKKQVEMLLSNIPYDEDIKTVFHRKLNEGLYESHKEFLRNPLLTIMMLITLAQFAEVPAKIHLFYEYAFDALFGRHDVTKAGFQRKRHTLLALDDFKRLFAYFCMITYTRELITFSTDNVLQFIQQAITSSQIVVDKVLFRNDLTESTCMLVVDGLDYTFSHRSFQEYFAAYFLSRVKVDEFERAAPKLVQRARFDGVIKMVAEMNREKFEEAWALPYLDEMCRRVEGIDVKENCIGWATALFETEATLLVPSGGDTLMLAFIPKRDGNARMQLNPASNARFALYQTYGMFDRIHARLKSDVDADKKIIKRIRDGEMLGDDPRFAKIREHGDGAHVEMGQLALTDADGAWYRDTRFGKVLQIESELLPKLRDEVKHSVEERRRGLDTIFPPES